MKRSVCASVLVLAALVFTPVASQAASPEKVHEYFEVTGMSKMVKDLVPSITANMVAAMKQGNPNLPPDTADIIGKVVSDTMIPLLPQMQASNEKIYADNFTDEEINGAIAYYKTPAGKSMLQKTPAVLQQAMQATQALVAAHILEIQQRLAQELQKRHPDQK